jgi:predicted transcriptional regulator
MSRITLEEGAILRLTTQIVAAYVSHNLFPSGDLSHLIKEVHQTLAVLGGQQPGEQQASKPAVPIRKSISDSYIVCLEDGKKLKMLKRYLRTQYQMTPDEYRSKWGLPIDYPMVAPNYAAQRSEFAKKIGLGKSATPRRDRRRSQVASSRL